MRLTYFNTGGLTRKDLLKITSSPYWYWPRGWVGDGAILHVNNCEDLRYVNDGSYDVFVIL